MVGVMLANDHQCLSFLERNGVISKSHKLYLPCGYRKHLQPVYRIPLNFKNLRRAQNFGSVKVNYGRINALIKEESSSGSIDGSVLREEFEFKPSFDEYLKAMESVRTGRNRESGDGSDSLELKNVSRRNDASRTPYLERDAQNKKRIKVTSDLDTEKSIQGQENGLFQKDFEEEELKSNERMENGMVKRKMRAGMTGAQKQLLGDFSKAKRVKESVAFDSSENNSKNRGREQKLEHRKLAFEIRKWNEGTASENEDAVRPNELPVRSRVWGNRDEVEKVNQRSPKTNKMRRSMEQYGNDINSEMERVAFKNFDEINDVVDAPKVPRVEMEERIQMLAKGLNGADIDMPEWMFSRMMRSAKIRFSDHSIMRVIQILGKLGNWRRVLQVIDWLQKRERFKSNRLRFIYTAALDVLGKARRPVEALNIFQTMQLQMSSYPDLVAYHSIAVTLGQAGYMKELFDVIDLMRSPPKKKFKASTLVKWDPRLEPDVVVYNAVLNACVKRKQWEGAFWVLQQLKEQGQTPSPTTYGLVMEVMFACGKYNLVHEFFRKVKKVGIPNVLIYKVLLNTLWKEGKTDEAIQAVEEMERRGIVGSAALYYDLARCLCTAGRCQEALLQIEKICRVANKPLVVTFTGLIQACLDSGNIQDGISIFHQMEKYCSPNLVTCNIMLKAYLDNDMFEAAKKLLLKMLDDGRHISSRSDYKVRVIPDAYSFNTMLDACLEERRWDELEYFYTKMLNHGHHFNSKRHLTMIVDASRVGKVGLLEMTWNSLIQNGRSPPPVLIKERTIMMLEKGEPSAALSTIVTHMTGNDVHAFSRKAWLKLLGEHAQRFQGDTLALFVQEVAAHIVASESPDPKLQNLVASCDEFLRTC